MPDIIHLLPDSVANQIAAGEVVQRPASVVKELLENSIDAGSTQIYLLTRESGKSLIQVSDNGCGMSETDARMSFERHATSKITRADDLFNINTLGFRGEALPSIASVARVEMKTRRKEDEEGTFIVVEGGMVKTHEPAACNTGTIISVKNLFYNIPVRKNFLKADTIEFRQILDFFQNIALVNPEIKFTFTNDKNEIYHLNKGSIRQRLVGILGKRYDSIIVPVNEETPIVRITGFIGKPDAAKKKKGEQYLFVNKRFIRNPYFNHAILSAYEGLLPAETFPFYALFLDVPPDKLDVNVHPTKTEVKFAEEKSIYLFIRSAVKKSLSQHHLAPSLDFEQEAFYKNIGRDEETGQNKGQLKIGLGEKKETGSSFSMPGNKITHDDWKELLKVLDTDLPANQAERTDISLPGETYGGKETEDINLQDAGMENRIMQIHQKYIFTPIRSGFMLIHQQYAHQRILFEEFRKMLDAKRAFSQKQLFPEVVEFGKADFLIVKELLPQLESIGFDIEVFSSDSVIFNGIPADIKIENCREFIEKMLEEYRSSLGSAVTDKKENLARALASNSAVKPGTNLTHEEMSAMIDRLFACENPYYSPYGKPVLLTISKAEIDKKFE